MKKLPLLILVIILTLTIFQFSCNSPTAPKQNTPPDTTSNNFTWQKFTFGADNAGSSHLSDVAIISDTNIWCVGAVYLDSADGAPDPSAYNAVHWDGNNWKLEKIQFYTFCGQQQTGSYPASAVLSLGDSIVWIASINSQIAILKSNIQTKIMCVPVSISKMWAASKNEVYTVGTIGQIGHYQNGSWQMLESGTTTAITDIWGSENTILATVTNEYETGDKRLLQINSNGTVDSLSWSPNSRLQTVWFQSTDKIFIGGGKHIVGKLGNWNEITELPAYYSERIRGNAPNDVFIVGAFGLCAHFNGSTWKTYGELYNSDESLYGLAVKGNLMVSVGQIGNMAIIIRGYRN